MGPREAGRLSKTGLSETRWRRGRSFPAGLQKYFLNGKRLRGHNHLFFFDDDPLGNELLFVLKTIRELAVFFLLLFRDGLTNGARILAAEGHLNGLTHRDHLGIFPNHVGPGDALQERPLTTARKRKRDENYEKSQASHERGIR